VMANTRDCRACGGTGEPVCSWCSEGIHYTTNFGCTDSAHWPETACPVCLGSGRVEDRIPASDAVADAETLRLVADGKVATLLRGAENGRRSVAIEYAYHGQGVAKGAARAAFRAVPGLRGDK
jgi:hypothetical protein